MNSHRILVVEDEKDLRDVYTLILSHEGYQVEQAGDGLSGLKKFSSFLPELILLDIYMPLLDGKGFLQKLELAKHPNTKVLVCSNTSDDTVIADMLRLGADKVVTKADLNPKDMSALVNSYFA